MLAHLPSSNRFHTKIGWLDSKHSFSFAEHYDPRRLGFRALRVINEDRVAPNQGFGTHPHQDMEIVTWVLEGELSHKDSMGNGSTIRPGDVQRMSAGTGVRHSEMNPGAEPVHFLQIWILPEKSGLAPSYEQKKIRLEDRKNRLRLVASRDGSEGSVTIHQDAAIWTAILDAGAKVEHALGPGRYAWLQVARGSVKLEGQPIAQGDGVAIAEESKITIEGAEPAEIILFDLS